MFERATKKLGLDQAIFMGGDYQSTDQPSLLLSQNQLINCTTNTSKKISNNEIEMLLKKGILGLLEK